MDARFVALADRLRQMLADRGIDISPEQAAEVAHEFSAAALAAFSPTVEDIERVEGQVLAERDAIIDKMRKLLAALSKQVRKMERMDE